MNSKETEFGYDNVEDQKHLKQRIKKAIEINDLDLLNRLFLSDSLKRMVNGDLNFNPFIIAIKANNLRIFDYLETSGILLDGIKSDKNNTNKKFKKNDLHHSNESGFSLCKQIPKHGYSKTLIEAIKCINYKAVELLLNLNVYTNSSNYKNVPLQISYDIYSKERDKKLFNQRDSNIILIEVSLL